MSGKLQNDEHERRIKKILQLLQGGRRPNSDEPKKATLVD
jgi:hypothetical protein